jgi:hypothetical protein
MHVEIAPARAMVPGMRPLAIAIVVIASVRTAAADVERVRLDYAAPPECPDRAAFVAQVGERTAALELDEGGDAEGASLSSDDRRERRFAVTITAVDDGFTGVLVVDDVADKQLAARRCDDLVAALALVTALAIDPEGRAVPRGEVAALPARRRRPVQAIAGGLVERGVAPAPLLAASVQLRIDQPAIERSSRTEPPRGRRWRLGAAMALVVGRDTSEVEGGGRARFTYVVARPSGCVLQELRVELAACANASIGVIRVAAEEIVNARALDRLWLSAGAGVLVRWPTRSRGFAQLELGASAPILRDRYRFNPGLVVHETPVVTGWLGVGVGVRL